MSQTSNPQLSKAARIQERPCVETKRGEMVQYKKKKNTDARGYKYTEGNEGGENRKETKHS